MYLSVCLTQLENSKKITYKQNEFYGGFIMVKYEERNW